ncbi:MAG: kynureninase [Caulobacteraceae bacterium]
MQITKDICRAWDADDPLAACRARFDLPNDVIYLDGNSLGALPRSTAARLQEVIRQEWGRDLIASWTSAGWMALPAEVGGRIARLIGARPHEVTAADSTSVNYYKLAQAALALRPERRDIVSETGDFPTDSYILQGLAAASDGRLTLKLVERDALAGALTPDTALLALSHVHYKTGAVHNMAGLTAAAHAAGAISLWDLSHSAGALDLELNAADVDLAVGCGYKYLNGGPGAPGFIYAAERLHAQLRPPIAGWIGHADPFAFDAEFVPATDVRQMLSGTPSVLGLQALNEGLKTFDGVAMADVRAKSVRLTSLFLDLAQTRLEPVGFIPVCPSAADERGSQASLRHPEAQRIMADLVAAGVVGDFRPPDLLRFGMTPLYTRYVDVFDAVDRIADVAQRP